MPDGNDNTDDGVARLRALLAAAGAKPGIGATMGFAIVDIERGTVTVEGTPGPSVYNPLGTVHGGYAATLLDTACALSVQSQLDGGRTHTTLELKISYLRGLTAESGTVRCVGRVVSLGRRVGFSEAALTDAAGRLCATATSTILVIEPKA